MLNEQIKIGIWCAYHITLEPSEGIGVFAHNIARGLASHPDVDSVHMVCKAGESDVVEPTVSRGNGKILSHELPENSSGQQSRYERAVATSGKFERLRILCEKKRIRASRSFSECSHSFGEKLSRYSIGQHLNCRPVRTLLALGKLITNRVSKPFWSLLRRVARSMEKRAARAVQLPEAQTESAIEALVGQCDVWLVPYVGLDRKFAKPTVVTVHDLVCFHFPDMLPPDALNEFKRLAHEVSAQSSVSACMSEYIAETDLRGVLELPEEKIRVVKATAPDDFGELADFQLYKNKYPILEQPFVFYPAAFRGYKNHEVLVEALALMACQGDCNTQLVFTGIHETPAALAQLIAQRGLSERVHILGKIDRDAMSLFYSRAQATIVPSLYEQGSYPLMEAMHWRCPIAASDIPQLRELFQSMGDSMEFFAPQNHLQLARLIRRMQSEREQIVSAQQAYREEILGRTWESAASDWLEVLNYAVQLEANVDAQPVVKVAA